MGKITCEVREDWKNTSVTQSYSSGKILMTSNFCLNSSVTVLLRETEVTDSLIQAEDVFLFGLLTLPINQASLAVNK